MTASWPGQRGMEAFWRDGSWGWVLTQNLRTPPPTPAQRGNIFCPGSQKSDVGELEHVYLVSKSAPN